MNDTSSVIRQASETFSSLRSIQSGVPKQLLSQPPGLLVFEYECELKKKTYTFDWVSSVMYFDELLGNKFNFPYAYTGEHPAGLYECIGSSYLTRIQTDLNVSGGTFRKHRHFVYWDEEFSWHITAEGLSISEKAA